MGCFALALATWQFAVEGVDEQSTEFGHDWFHVARVHDHSPLPVTLLDYSSLPQRVSTGNFNSTPAFGPHEGVKEHCVRWKHRTF